MGRAWISVLQLCLHISLAISETIVLTKLTNSQARCLDGTLSGYYLEKAQMFEESSKWVLYLQGGGECDNQEDCYSKLDSDLGSSKYFKANYTDSSSWYWASSYCPYNPMFCGWNHVNVPYCSQDLYSGTKTMKSADTWDLYFSGHLILEAIFDSLDKEGLKEAKEIILTGVSAGGLGTFINIDYVAERYPDAKVTAATIAGFYYFATYYSGTNATNPADQIADFTPKVSYSPNHLTLTLTLTLTLVLALSLTLTFTLTLAVTLILNNPNPNSDPNSE